MRFQPKTLSASLLCLMGMAMVAESAEDSLGAQPPKGAVVLLGKDNDPKSTWTKRNGDPIGWTFEDGVLTVKGGTGDIKTKDEFSNYQMHVEFRTPYMPEAKGQGRGNSGVYQAGRYELQVLDSYGLKPQDNDCGAIYKQYAPAVNACRKPLEWQSYDITFRSAKLADGKEVEKARITVIQNGQKILDDKPISVTPGGLDMKPGLPGQILLQDHGNTVSFRNMWIKPL
ncbi:MAG: DUF1080 domain-containing protein [Planctomycetota bacterium]|nr:MAG: DUF1080 domain-containing protein [Planctomycetota bacterium]